MLDQKGCGSVWLKVRPKACPANWQPRHTVQLSRVKQESVQPPSTVAELPLQGPHWLDGTVEKISGGWLQESGHRGSTHPSHVHWNLGPGALTRALGSYCAPGSAPGTVGPRVLPMPPCPSARGRDQQCPPGTQRGAEHFCLHDLLQGLQQVASSIWNLVWNMRVWDMKTQEFLRLWIVSDSFGLHTKSPCRKCYWYLSATRWWLCSLGGMLT